MNYTEFDVEHGKKITKSLHVIEEIRNLAIYYLQNYISSDKNRYFIYYADDEFGNCVYFDFCRGNDLHLTFETDMGIKFHQYYNTPEEILYGIYVLEEMKKNKVSENTENRSVKR